MSKSSTASLPKNPQPQLSSKSAWAKGPPQAAAIPSPRSQSPVPSNGPQPTHSRRPSMLGQGVPIKDGVSIPGKNVGAVKQGSSVTFGSIDDASAPISSSPASVAPIKSEIVKSFGQVPATNTTSHVNGKPSISKSIGVSSPTATAAPSSSAKFDIKSLFQSPSTPAPPSQPETTSSPSLRTTGLPPSSSQPQNASQPSQPTQFGSQFSTFVPQNMRPPQQNAGASGSRPPQSPGFRPNGTGPRPPNGPSGPGAPGSAMGSPRLSQNPQPGMPPNGMPQGMPPQMPPQMAWTGYYYPPAPGLPPEQAAYMFQPGGWYMPQPQPGMPPQQQPMPVPQHISPQPGMPMSPRNLPMQIHSGPGTPTPAHAAPVPPHIPPPLAQHSSSGSVNSVTSPPPTPSTARSLNTGAPTFVPGGANRPKSKIVLKSADGTEIKLDQLKQQNQTGGGSASSTPKTTPSPLPAVAPSPGPGHQSRKSVQVRMETEEARKKRIADEEAKEKEEKAKAAKAKADAEEKERKEKEEAERKKKEEEEKEKKRLEEEKERKRKEEEEKERLRLEEERKKKEEEEAAAAAAAKAKAEVEEKERKEREEQERKALEEKERLKKEEDEKLRQQAEEEVAKLKEQASTVTDEPETISEEVEEGEISEDAPKPAKDGLRIDTSGTSSDTPRRRPGRLDLSTTLKTNIPAALPSALATARIIDDLTRVPYPENIQSPKVELNVNATDGKFRYDRDFLLQFMSICKEKPDNLPPLDAIGIGPVDQNTMTRTSSRGGRDRGSSRTSSFSGPPSAGGGAGFPFGAKGPPPFGGSMGHFQGGAKLTSEERYARSISGPAVAAFGGRPSPMTRTASQGGGVPSNLGNGNKRTRSKRGETRDKNANHQQSFAAPGMENVAPLQVSANRWDRRALNQLEADSPEVVDRKVKSLLNKLTMEKFDSISDQIIEWANKSEKEKDGRTLIQVIRLVFEKATDEATWSEMYARLCRKMMEQISPKVQDDGIKNAEGKPIAGGQLFRKYLLNRCQEDFERGWAQKEASALAAAAKATEDKAKAQENEAAAAAGESTDDPVLYSDEYYAAQKAKRQGLGLIKFIGELFKLQMLTERIMHECVKKLLGNVENPEEEEIESLCKLISTVGSLLDTAKARAHMDVYFSRMKELAKLKSVGSRMQFMLQDVIELRERKWTVRSNQMAAPSTLAGVHEAAAKEQQAKAEKDQYQRTISMSRGGSRRGNDRGEFQGPGADGWTNVAGSSTPRPPPKAGDLTNFGKIGTSGKAGLPLNLGPSSVFSGRKDSKRESLSRTNSMSSMSAQNAFALLSQQEGTPEAKPAEAPAQRKRLVLQPRSIPTGEQGSATAEGTPVGSDDDDESEEDAGAVPEMSAEAADRKVAEDSKEFFAIRNLEEAEVYFSALPVAHHARLVEKLVGTAVESKEANAQLVADLFAHALSKDLCSADALEEGILPLAEILEDIAIDAPRAPNNLALIMKTVGFGAGDERAGRIAEKTGDADRLLALLS